MNEHFKHWLFEVVILIAYKAFFEFVYLARYMYLFSYAYTGTIHYGISIDKWIISVFILLIFLLLLFGTHNKKNIMYEYLIRFIYMICIIPMLSVYAFFVGIDYIDILYPTLFWIITIAILNKYANRGEMNERQLFKMPKILHVNPFILMMCVSIAVIIWVSRGMPVFIYMSDALAQRLELRASAMPRIVGYIFTFLGGTVFPYLFAKYLDQKKPLISFICLFSGILLFFINGMKTWFFLYLFYFMILFIFKFGKSKSTNIIIIIEIMVLALIVFAVLINDRLKIIDGISQLARVVVVPNEIGFRSVAFFKSPENEFLYLRESVLRSLFESPYPNGSDYYIVHGTNVTTSSSRANNGLWGDAYKNFGLFGIVIYPFVISKIINIVESNGRHMNSTLRLFLLFMILWGSINTSFFTWLLTGGVIVLILLEKIDRSIQEDS